MNTNKLDNITLSPEDVERINTAFHNIRDAMPFLTGLSPTEKRRMSKIGTKAQDFTDKALNMAMRYPKVIPQGLDVDAAQEQMVLFRYLYDVLQQLNELKNLVECTQMLAGSEAYAAARLAYRSVKTVGGGNGLDMIVEDLARQFRRSSRRQDDELEPATN
ncbi:MAG: hypothetical protein AAFN18_13805 [Cyanobacteria bacterium J06554_6]